MNVCYHGPLFDYSGYGEANRHAVAALDAAGVNVIAKSVSYVSESADFGTIGQRVIQLTEIQDNYSIKIIHTTPDQYKRYMELGKYHIGHFFWETDKVPKDFVDGLNLMDEIWTGSNANSQAMRAGGVTTKIKIFPQAIETDREWPEPYKIQGFDGILYYSIFEWTDRKNPEALLEAYWKAFQNDENVGLLIKTYFRNFTLENKQMIRTAIKKLKAKSGLKKFPPVFLYMDLMDRRHIMRLHKTGDVFVSAHRGEGWGIPQVEAALAGNAVISTGYGGCHEWFDGGINLISYDMVPVNGMAHSTKWYSDDQNWAEINKQELIDAMQNYYSYQGLIRMDGEKAQSQVIDIFNLENVGDMMANRLEIIEGKING